MTDLQLEKYIVKPGKKVNLHKIDANEFRFYKETKDAALLQIRELNFKLDELQQTQHGEKKRKILIIFQGMDASGKDGAIRNVFHSVNPSGVYVAHFGAPSRMELSHDFLWRVHDKAPANGEMVIFNRSHYEDVLIVRVQNLKPRELWEQRFHHITEFERMLYDEGTHIYKFYLHISNDEQRQRLQDRVDNPDKHWKIEPNDFNDREHWNEYIEAYNDVLNRTSRRWAPWYIIPANKKWYRDLLISNILVNELTKLKMKYPKAKQDFSGIVVK
jgi:PPK2 family polyphosphate:nucleotide phosphotransferase